MRTYKPGDDVGMLEPWPLNNPASDYVIRQGAPETSGRIEAGGPGHTSRFGIWRCTEGAFECTEQGDELMTVLAGRCRITDQGTGDTVELVAGDSLFIRDGARVTWDVIEDVTKVFFGQKSDGY
ncbi:cupin domain-containing protein [Ruegeria sp. 2012CJ41-6]|uniref:Cupin domain-containing protein n=1 Tax=Ruegeria spongiae TaxID=2942209 RepID=A0ABT0Q399_9RHOB|nr:cupin domain-containing protein [Ruegeria spongiae]MCL6283907.1 cupin domain-containing protein [Ruegeria spongiae]